MYNISIDIHIHEARVSVACVRACEKERERSENRAAQNPPRSTLFLFILFFPLLVALIIKKKKKKRKTEKK